ncbi:hypothetical protein V8E53_010490 [Lactarius tabidus]
MPRQSRSSRPTTSRSAPAPASAPSRGASTAAFPAQHAPPAPAPPAKTSAPAAPAQTQASSGPGMLAQMAATAGSVAVGSTIGHGISSMLFGGRSEPAPAEQQQQAVPQQNTSSFAQNCEVQAKDFSKCIEKADLQSCSWYLEQLKACQSAASQY